MDGEALYAWRLNSKEMKLVYTPPVDRQIAVPRWSPDGKTIAFIGGLMSDEGFLGGDIFTLDERWSDGCDAGDEGVGDWILVARQSRNSVHGRCGRRRRDRDSEYSRRGKIGVDLERAGDAA